MTSGGRVRGDETFSKTLWWWRRRSKELMEVHSSSVCVYVHVCVSLRERALDRECEGVSEWGSWLRKWF